jgi:hypothetical protein
LIYNGCSAEQQSCDSKLWPRILYSQKGNRFSYRFEKLKSWIVHLWQTIHHLCRPLLSSVVDYYHFQWLMIISYVWYWTEITNYQLLWTIICYVGYYSSTTHDIQQQQIAFFWCERYSSTAADIWPSKTKYLRDGFRRVESSQTPARGPQFGPNVQL